MLSLNTADAPAQTSATPKAATATATGKKRRSYVGPQARVMTQIAAAWNGMNASERDSWLVFQGQASDIFTNGVPNKANAYATFLKYNTILLGAGQSIATTASGDLTPPYPLPALTFSATTGSLTLHSPVSYGPSVVIYAAKPLLGATNVYSKKAFRRIGSLAGLHVGANDISALYFAKYRIPGPNFQIALKVMGVMDSGLHTLQTVITTIVSA